MSNINGIICLANQRVHELGERYGQAIFNAACELEGHRAAHIAAQRGDGEFDPFYDSGNVNRFLAALEETR